MKFSLYLYCCLLVYSFAWAQPYSELWGEKGELWSTESRLPDFSFAGYRFGEQEIPTLSVTANIKDFGAVGDGEADDTQAFKDAIAKTPSGAIRIPEGRYKITDILEIRKSNLVLRGESPEKTILFFPEYLNDILPNWGATTTGDRTSNYSWSGGFLWLKGSFQNRVITQVAEPALRGAKRLRVNSTRMVKVGQTVEIRLKDTPQNSLASHLYSESPGSMDQLKGSTKASLVCRIVAIEENDILIDRPLRCNIQLEWSPTVEAFEPTVVESGIENIGFEFPVKPYAGHFTELGYNPIAMSSVAHCWVKNIRIVNCDSGLFVSSKFCTVDGVVFDTSRPPDKTQCTGHHGIYLSNDDNVYRNFTYNMRFIHDLTVSHCAGNVCCDGAGVDLCFDHHKRTPYENLFTNIDIGAGTRIWKCGGGADLGKNCAARGTFWTIRAARPQSYPPTTFGPSSMNLVGVQANTRSVIRPDGLWFETIPPADLLPQNLYEAQQLRRLQAAEVEWKMYKLPASP